MRLHFASAMLSNHLFISHHVYINVNWVLWFCLANPRNDKKPQQGISLNVSILTQLTLAAEINVNSYVFYFCLEICLLF